MKLRSAILASVRAFAALVETQPMIPGEERALLCAAAKTSGEPLVDDTLAAQIADFLPIALGRHELRPLGVELDDHYGRLDSKGRLRSFKLRTQEPVFCDAAVLASGLFAAQRQLSQRLARISCEYQFVQAQLAAGIKAINIKVGPPLLRGPDELCEPWGERPKFDGEPWWLREVKKQQKPWWKVR